MQTTRDDTFPIDLISKNPKLHRHQRVLVKVPDIALLHRMKDTVIPLPIPGQLRTRSALVPIPPVREQEIALLGPVEEALEVTGRIAAAIEAALRDVAVHDVFVLDPETVCVDEMGEHVLFWEGLQVGFSTALFVGFPVCCLAFAGAVEGSLAFGAMF